MRAKVLIDVNRWGPSRCRHDPYV